MKSIEQQYLDLLREVLADGEDRADRTGVGTRSLFGRQLRCHLKDGFPALTTKQLAWKACVAELKWFLEGSTDERRLCELTHGTRDFQKTTIWTGNAEAPYWRYKAKYAGDLGRVYGAQWRAWRHVDVKRSDGVGDITHYDASGNVEATTHFGVTITETKIDQVRNIIEKLKTNLSDRRLVLTAFNVGELDQMALPPCHMFCQFYASVERQELSCQVYIRSNDLFLGLPFNLASYALLTHLVARSANLGVGELIVTIGDAHIYKNHFDAVNEQLARDVRPLPTLWLNPVVKDIDDFTTHDVRLDGYNPYPAIKAPMAV